MRTYAYRQEDLATSRYEKEADEFLRLDPTNPTEAKAILASKGGRVAAKRALAQLWKANNETLSGVVKMAHISAPYKVMVALETMQLVKREEGFTEKDVTVDDYMSRKAVRFKLTGKGKKLAAEAQANVS